MGGSLTLSCLQVVFISLLSFSCLCSTQSQDHLVKKAGLAAVVDEGEAMFSLFIDPIAPLRSSVTGQVLGLEGVFCTRRLPSLHSGTMMCLTLALLKLSSQCEGAADSEVEKRLCV